MVLHSSPNSFLDVEQCRIPETWENGLAPSLEVPWLTGLEMGLGLILMILEYAHDIVTRLPQSDKWSFYTSQLQP